METKSRNSRAMKSSAPCADLIGAGFTCQDNIYIYIHIYICILVYNTYTYVIYICIIHICIIHMYIYVLKM